ncbi:tripartite tricarboxylate transporter TctB family protein [Denitrobaculum tricleocarpae]|uniref:DUF1468 domain-containing protein n=1 Tax=Denitrobaculum tricleocarpae TaxID=2591009 RepID=A0A545TMV7_9PROT|nr:tripartite tricarboxylate transporter TctB family protein [Denitrobaculum tricleocarpae]TQV78570.1 hypothetical protein FKG95_18625 [Denitrobaculum tricleocarpae]
MKKWFSLGLVGLSSAYLAYGLRTLDILDFSGRPGAGYFPLIIGGLLLLATAVNAVLDFREARQGEMHPLQLDPATEGTAELMGVDAHGLDGGRRFPRDVLIILALLSGFIFLLPVLGALAAMIVLMLAYLFTFNQAELLTNVLYALALPAFLYWLFSIILNASLPVGPFGF